MGIIAHNLEGAKVKVEEAGTGYENENGKYKDIGGGIFAWIANHEVWDPLKKENQDYQQDIMGNPYEKGTENWNRVNAGLDPIPNIPQAKPAKTQTYYFAAYQIKGDCEKLYLCSTQPHINLKELEGYISSCHYAINIQYFQFEAKIPI